MSANRAIETGGKTQAMMTAQEWYAAQPKPYVTSGITLAEDYAVYVREATLEEVREMVKEQIREVLVDDTHEDFNRVRADELDDVLINLRALAQPTPKGEHMRIGYDEETTENWPERTPKGEPRDVSERTAQGTCNSPFVAAGSKELGIEPCITDRCALPYGHEGRHQNGPATWGCEAERRAPTPKGEPRESLKELFRVFEGVPIKFGLAAQGHLPTVARMLSEGKTWDEIGDVIGWHGPTVKQYWEIERRAPTPKGEPRACEHKEINDEGFCKSCGARAAIEIEGLSEHLARQRREAVDLRPNRGSESEAAKEKVDAPRPVELELGNKRWVCAARASDTGPNDPQDCDWPTCGCDEHAEKVMAALQECGWGKLRVFDGYTLDSLEEAILKLSWDEREGDKWTPVVRVGHVMAILRAEVGK